MGLVGAIWTVTIGLWLQLPQPISAQSSQEDTTVRAVIPDQDPPGDIVLISPNDQAVTSDNTPTFIWQESDDSLGIDEYEFWLNDTLFFDNLPTDDDTTSEYELTYDSGTGYYSLVPLDSLADGDYTWMIKARNIVNLTTDSATWDFTIDTQPPNFVVTQIGELTTAISAQDASSVPAIPLEVDTNPPLIVATGEAEATVNLTVTIPSDPNQVYTTQVAGDGSWQQLLTILPRGETIFLSFIITDLANQVSTITNVPILLPQDTIVIPPASPSPSPSPGANGDPDPDDPTDDEPLIEIPITPPDEILDEVIQETDEAFNALVENVVIPIAQPVAAPIARTTSRLLNAIRPPTTRIGLTETIPIAPLLLTVAVPVATTVTLSGGFSLQLFGKIIQALGLFPAGKPQGMVFDSETHQPVAFALITILKAPKNTTTVPTATTTPFQETVVTDVNGVYRGIKLEPSDYTITVTHQDYLFPTKKPRPAYLTINDYYKGEVFTPTSTKTTQQFLIPADPKQTSGYTSWKDRFRLVMTRLSTRLHFFIFPLLAFSAYLVLLDPNLWNWGVFGIYAFMAMDRVVEWFKIPNLSGTVVDQLGQPVPRAIIRLSNAETGELAALVTTDPKGVFEISIEPDLYQISITKTGFYWQEATSLGLNQVDLRNQNQSLAASLQPTTNLIADLIG